MTVWKMSQIWSVRTMGGISYKLLVEFRQIYNVGAVGDKDDLV